MCFACFGVDENAFLTLIYVAVDNVRVGIVGGLGVEPPVHVYTDAHFLVKIGHKLQSLGKISHLSAADPPVLLGQFQHWIM